VFRGPGGRALPKGSERSRKEDGLLRQASFGGLVDWWRSGSSGLPKGRGSFRSHPVRECERCWSKGLRWVGKKRSLKVDAAMMGVRAVPVRGCLPHASRRAFRDTNCRQKNLACIDSLPALPPPSSYPAAGLLEAAVPTEFSGRATFLPCRSYKAVLMGRRPQGFRRGGTAPGAGDCP